MKTKKQKQLNKLAAKLRQDADSITDQNKAKVWEQFKEVFKLYSEVTTEYLLEMQARIDP